MKKNLKFSIIIILTFFLILEIGQRVRWFMRFEHPYWLGYGIVKRPPESELNIGFERGMLREQGAKEIKVNSIQYNGYYTHNPECEGINSHGFRGKEITEKISHRIICLGGSTTYCASVKDNETYPYYLEQILGTEVINAGIVSIGLKGIMNLYKHEILPLKPDRIMLISMYNNLRETRNVFKKRNSLLSKLDGFLLKHSLFYCTFREKIYCRRLGKPSRDLYIGTAKEIAENYSKDTGFWLDLKSLYNEIIEISKENDVEIILVKCQIWLGYGNWLMHKPEMRPVYERYYQMLDEIGEEHNVLVVDAFTYFDQAKNKEELFVDGLHLTAKGNKILAEIIRERIGE